MSDRRFALGFGLILLVGTAGRLGLMSRAWDRPLDDPDRYFDLARSVADGRGLGIDGRPTAYRPPLYPILLSIGVDRRRVTTFGLNLALGLATIGCVAVASLRWGSSRAAACLSATLVALDPVLISQAPAVMTETLAAFLVAAMLAAIDPSPRVPGLVLAGLLGGLAALSRPSLLPAVGLLAMGLCLVGPGRLVRRIVLATAFAIGVVVVLMPWALRNLGIFGEAVLTTTHGGYTFALANNPAYYDDVIDGPPGAVWSGPNQARWFERINRVGAGLAEPEADRAYYVEGVRTIGDRPGDFVRAAAARLGRFWSITPSSRVYPPALRLATAAWTIPFWILVGVAVIRRPVVAWPVVAALAVPVALTAVHAFYWTDLRMRAPAVPALALIAGTWGGRSRRAGASVPNLGGGPAGAAVTGSGST